MRNHRNFFGSESQHKFPPNFIFSNFLPLFRPISITKKETALADGLSLSPYLEFNFFSIAAKVASEMMCSISHPSSSAVCSSTPMLSKKSLRTW